MVTEVTLVIGFLLIAGVGAIVSVAVYRRRREMDGDVELFSNICEGHYHKAVPALLRQGRVAEAARLEALRGRGEAAVELYESCGDIRGAASVYLSDGDWDMAAMCLRDGGMPVKAADAFVLGGRLKSALKLLLEVDEGERAMELAEQSGDSELYAAVLRRLGRSELSARVLATAAHQRGDYEDAATRWESIGTWAKAADAWLEAGRTAKAAQCFVLCNQPHRAYEAFRKAGQLDGAAKVAISLGRHMEGGALFERIGDLDRALKAYEQADAWFAMARVLEAQGEIGRAISLLDQLGPLEKGFEEGKERLVALLQREERFGEACAVLQQLIERRVDTTVVDGAVRRWAVLSAELHLKSGQHAKAMMLLKQLDSLKLLTADLRMQLDEMVSGSEVSVDLEPLGLPEHPRYRFITKLGQGGHGVIYRAKDLTLEREVAIKMIARSRLDSEMARRFFMREAKLAAQLNHPNIVTIHDLGQIEDRMYIAMELIPGVPLSKFLRMAGPRLSASEGLPILLALCDALYYAHQRGVVHRDVKLENVMVHPERGVKLMDFGLARALESDIAQANVIQGTPLYMSPEQICGLPLDHRTDLYAIGVMLFRMFAGKWPYSGGDVVRQHCDEPVPNPCDEAPELPAEFGGLVMSLLAKEPEDRPADARLVAQSLQRVFRGD